MHFANWTWVNSKSWDPFLHSFTTYTKNKLASFSKSVYSWFINIIFGNNFTSYAIPQSKSGSLILVHPVSTNPNLSTQTILLKPLSALRRIVKIDMNVVLVYISLSFLSSGFSTNVNDHQQQLHWKAVCLDSCSRTTCVRHLWS